MNTVLVCNPNPPESQQRLAEMYLDTDCVVLLVTWNLQKMAISYPGAIFEPLPRAQTTKLGPKNGTQP